MLLLALFFSTALRAQYRDCQGLSLGETIVVEPVEEMPAWDQWGMIGRYAVGMSLPEIFFAYDPGLVCDREPHQMFRFYNGAAIVPPAPLQTPGAAVGSEFLLASGHAALVFKNHGIFTALYLPSLLEAARTALGCGWICGERKDGGASWEEFYVAVREPIRGLEHEREFFTDDIRRLGEVEEFVEGVEARMRNAP